MAELRMDPELLLAHAPFVRSLARALLRDENDVDDVVQQTWLAALRHPPRDPGAGGAVRGWLARVVKSVVRETRRGDERRDRRERQAAPPELLPEVDPAHAVERLHLLRELVDAVLALAEPYRSTVMQRYLEELAPAAIARREQVPVATINTRLRRAREQLRRKLDERHGDERRAALLATLTQIGGLESGVLAEVMALGLTAKLVLAAAALALITWIAWPHATTKKSDGASASDGAIQAATVTAAVPSSTPVRADEVAEQDSAGAPPKPGVTLRVVAKESGKPVSGATVRFHAAAADPRDDLRKLYIDEQVDADRFFDGDRFLQQQRRIEVRLARDCRTFQSDANGEVVVPRFTLGLVSARQGELVAARPLDGSASEPVVLELEREIALRVETVDAGGRPVADVPVMLQHVSELPLAWWRGTTRGELALAEISAADLSLLKTAMHGSTHGDFVVTLGLPAADAPRVALDLGRLPDDPVKLVLPPTGRLHVDVRAHDGAPLRESGWLGIGPRLRGDWYYFAGNDQPWSPMHWRPIENGAAEIEAVGLGGELALYVHVKSEEFQPTVTLVTGPARASETKNIVAVAGPPIAVVTGRLLGPDDEPIRDWVVHAKYEIALNPHARAVATDEEGFFRIPLARFLFEYSNNARAPRNELALTLEHGGALDPALSDALVVRKLSKEELEPGLHELGDLRLGASTPVATGRIVDREGKPHAGVELMIEQLIPGGWHWSSEFDTRSRGDGSFVLPGRAGVPRLRLFARGDGCLLPEPLEFEAGATNLEVIVATASELRGTLLVDVDVPLADIVLSLAGGLAARGAWFHDENENFEVSTDGTFRLANVPAGRGSVTLGLGRFLAQFEPIQTIDDVVAKGGEPLDDVRLTTIDLRGKLRLLELRVLDADGRPVARAMVKVLAESPQPPEVARYSATDDKGVARFAIAAATHRVDAEADGFEPVTLTGVPSSCEIVLRRVR